MKTLMITALMSLSTLPCFAFACKVRFPKHAPTASLSDPFVHVLAASPECPSNILELAQLMKSLGLDVSPSMVANRGFHNPSQGSFSFFEEVSGTLRQLPPIERGQFFIGHFTVRTPSNNIALDQANRTNKLLVELIAWDFKKRVFNFYELIGGNPQARWFYRGDSFDIWADNQKLFRNKSTSETPFGQRLRCSACHTSGGPIMKELAYPHNDWWKKDRPLWLGRLKPEVNVSGRLAHLQDASAFASSVLKGIQLLQKSEAKHQALRAQSLQEVLRPLFCDQEINLVSGYQPLMTPEVGSATSIDLPSRIFQNPFFGEPKLQIKKQVYIALLKKLEMHFPETKLPDADHPWLAPVKSEADHIAVLDLIQLGLIDAEFAGDVLAVDMTTPLFSKARCDLVWALPDRPFFPAWKTEFMNRLQHTPGEGAQQLIANFQSPERTQKFHRRMAEQNLRSLQELLHQKEGSELLFRKLISARQAVFDSEISKNPLGQILEPGFRVIFPVPAGRH